MIPAAGFLGPSPVELTGMGETRRSRSAKARLCAFGNSAGRVSTTPTREKIREYRAPTSGQIMVLLKSYARRPSWLRVGGSGRRVARRRVGSGPGHRHESTAERPTATSPRWQRKRR